KVASKPVEEPPPEVKPAPNPEVAVEPPREVQHESPRQSPHLPAPMTSAPQAIPERTAALPAAPTQGRLTPQNSSALATWRSQIVGALEHKKLTPEPWARRGERGSPQFFFSLDRQGRVMDSRVVRSAGASAPEGGALALWGGAHLFPPVPPEIL